jgi:hypothetical protein
MSPLLSPDWPILRRCSVFLSRGPLQLYSQPSASPILRRDAESLASRVGYTCLSSNSLFNHNYNDLNHENQCPLNTSVLAAATPKSIAQFETFQFSID